jgi:hypothetical protein
LILYNILYNFSVFCYIDRCIKLWSRFIDFFIYFIFVFNRIPPKMLKQIKGMWRESPTAARNRRCHRQEVTKEPHAAMPTVPTNYQIKYQLFCSWGSENWELRSIYASKSRLKVEIEIEHDRWAIQLETIKQCLKRRVPCSHMHRSFPWLDHTYINWSPIHNIYSLFTSDPVLHCTVTCLHRCSTTVEALKLQLCQIGNHICLMLKWDPVLVRMTALLLACIHAWCIYDSAFVFLSETVHALMLIVSGTGLFLRKLLWGDCTYCF